MDQTSENSPRPRSSRRVERSLSVKSSPEPKGRERFLPLDLNLPKQILGHRLTVFGLTVLSLLPLAHTQPIELSKVPTVTLQAATSQEVTAPTTPAIPELKDFQNDQERINQTLAWKYTTKLIVADPRLGIPEKEQEFWTNRMLQIIFVESGGDSQASSGIAYGLTQLRPTTAKEVAKQYQIIKYDLNNGWDNIFLGLAYQLNLAKRYDPELAGWAHHLGLGNMDVALRTYLVQEKKLPIAEVDKLFNTTDTDKLLETINNYQITPQTLLGSPAVTARLKAEGAFEDFTNRYYLRLLAASQVLNQS